MKLIQNPNVRKAIYAVIASLLVLFSALHLIDDATAKALGDVADKLLAAAALYMAVAHTPKTAP